MVYRMIGKHLTMKFLIDMVRHFFIPAKALLPLAVLLLLSACAAPQSQQISPPAFQHAGVETKVADVDVLAVSPAMEAFLQRYILKYSDRQTRLTLLIHSVTSNGVLGFDYDESLTLSSTETFDARAGNCIGFANMVIAMARRSGLKADYQEVYRRPEWSSHEDTVLLIKHINVIVSGRGYTYVVDASGIKIDPNIRRRIVRDNYAKALYLNNIGAEALLKGDLPTAYAYMSKAIDTEPLMTDPWVNLGVVFSRNSQFKEAETAFQRALQIDSSEYSAMSNLYELYLAQDDLQAAEQLQAKVEDYRWGNPYHLLKLSNAALEESQFEESTSLLRRAIRKKRGDHLLHFALAKTQYLSGQFSDAHSSMLRVKELAPEAMQVYYGRPLEELVAER